MRPVYIVAQIEEFSKRSSWHQSFRALHSIARGSMVQTVETFICLTRRSMFRFVHLLADGTKDRHRKFRSPLLETQTQEIIRGVLGNFAFSRADSCYEVIGAVCVQRGGLCMRPDANDSRRSCLWLPTKGAHGNALVIIQELYRHFVKPKRHVFLLLPSGYPQPRIQLWEKTWEGDVKLQGTLRKGTAGRKHNARIYWI